MKGIKVTVDFSEWTKVDEFISELNIDSELLAYGIDNTSFIIVGAGECSMAYVKAELLRVFDSYDIEIIK